MVGLSLGQRLGRQEWTKGKRQNSVKARRMPRKATSKGPMPLTGNRVIDMINAKYMAENYVKEVMREMPRPPVQGLQSTQAAPPKKEKVERDVFITWNARTMRTADKLEVTWAMFQQMCGEGERLKMAALQEVRLQGSAILENEDEGFVFIHQNSEEAGRKGIRGLGFMLDREFAHRAVYEKVEVAERWKDRIMALRFRLGTAAAERTSDTATHKPNYLYVVNVYMPTEAVTDSQGPAEAEEAYAEIQKMTSEMVGSGDRLMVLGDFNACTGHANIEEPEEALCIGQYGMNKRNANGDMLMAMLRSTKMRAMNTCFRAPKAQRGQGTFWQRNAQQDGARWKRLDYILVQQVDADKVMNASVLPVGVKEKKAISDHNVVKMTTAKEFLARLTVNDFVRTFKRPKGVVKAKADLGKIAQNRERRVQYNAKVDAGIRQYIARGLVEEHSSVEHIEALGLLLCTSAMEVGGSKGRLKTGTLADMKKEAGIPDLTRLVGTLKAKIAIRADREGPAAKEKVAKLKLEFTETQKLLRQKSAMLHDRFLRGKAAELERCVQRGNSKGIKRLLQSMGTASTKEVVTTTLIDKATGEVLSDPVKLSALMGEYFDQLLNVRADLDEDMLENLKQYPVNMRLDEPITKDEFLATIARLESGKATGLDDISVELFKLLTDGSPLVKDGPDTLDNVSIVVQLLNALMDEGTVPEGWREADIRPLFKGKGSAQLPENYRGISLLSQFSKIVAKIMDRRCQAYIDNELGEIMDTQFGFSAGRGTHGAIFTLMGMQQYALQQNKSLFVAFVDFAKAYDCVPRVALWKVLEKSGIPPKMLKFIKNLHEGMVAHVTYQGVASENFSIETGVAQGLVIACTLFKLFLARVLEAVEMEIAEYEEDVEKEIADGTMTAEDRIDWIEIQSDFGAAPWDKTDLNKDLSDSKWAQVQEAEYNAKGNEKAIPLRDKKACSSGRMRVGEARASARTRRRIWNVLFADDSKIMTRSERSTQLLLSMFDRCARKFGMSINIKKTEVMEIKRMDQEEFEALHTASGKDEPRCTASEKGLVQKHFSMRVQLPDYSKPTVDGKHPMVLLKQVAVIKDLGFLTTINGSVLCEAKQRIKVAGFNFWQQQQSVFRNAKVKLEVKLKMYCQFILATLLHNCGLWVIPTQKRNDVVTAMRDFHRRSGLRILGMATWSANCDLGHHFMQQKTQLMDLSTMMRVRRLRMAGDFHHLPDGRLEKLVLYGDILGGRNGDPFAYREPHAMGKPPGSFADQIKLDMIAFGMDPKQFTTLVEDKAAWRCTIDACAQAAQKAFLAEARPTRSRAVKRKARRRIVAVEARKVAMAVKVAEKAARKKEREARKAMGGVLRRRSTTSERSCSSQRRRRSDATVRSQGTVRRSHRLSLTPRRSWSNEDSADETEATEDGGEEECSGARSPPAQEQWGRKGSTERQPELAPRLTDQGRVAGDETRRVNEAGKTTPERSGQVAIPTLRRSTRLAVRQGVSVIVAVEEVERKKRVTTTVTGERKRKQAKAKVVPKKGDTGKQTKGTTVPKGKTTKQIKETTAKMTKEGLKAVAVVTRSRMKSSLKAVAMESKEEYEGAMTRSRCRTKTTGEKQATEEQSTGEVERGRAVPHSTRAAANLSRW